MKQIKIVTLCLSVLVGATSCDFTETCEYTSKLNVHNNWQNHTNIPKTNQVIAYGNNDETVGPVNTTSNANGHADSTSFVLHYGGYEVLSFTDEKFSLGVKANSGSLNSAKTAYAYVDMVPVELQDGRVLENPVFPGYYYSSYNTGDLDLRNPVSCIAMQRLHTRFVRFLYNVIYEYSNTPKVNFITTDLSGVATQLNLKTGEGVTQSSVTVFSRPEKTEIKNEISGKIHSYFMNQISCLSFLPRTSSSVAAGNDLIVHSFLKDGNIRSASLDLTDYFDTFTDNYATVTIDVVVEKEKIHLELAAWETGIWKEFIIK